VTRAVLDPNVIVAAAITPSGLPATCLRAHAEGRFDLIVSPHLLDELRTVLRRPKLRQFLTVEQADRLVEALARDAKTVADPPEPEQVSRDPRDDYLVALTRAAGAHVLVTGDADLLDLTLGDVTIAPPREFLEILPE
jgi:putative PIN family toxin of toxin-antitoxin system